MSKKKSSNLAPLAASIGCLGVAAASSLISGSLTGGALPIAGMLLNGLMGDLSINIASDQILKVSPTKLRKSLLSKSKDISNHDLQKGLKEALKTALIKCYEIYEESSTQKKSSGHLRALRRKINQVCEAIDANFLLEMEEELKENEVLDYDEGLNNRINGLLEDYLYEIEDFKDHGKSFIPLLQSQLPLQITAAFTEELKTNPRSWIAYQKSLLQDLRSNDQIMMENLSQNKDKLDNIISSLEALNIAGSTLDDKFFQTLIKGNSDVNALLNSSIEQLEQYHDEFKYRIHQLEERLIAEIQSQSDILQLNNTLLNEVHASILGKEEVASFDELHARVLPQYLNYIIEEYRLIALPSIKRGETKKTIPLDNIYVALQLADNQTSKDFHYASQFVRKQIINEELNAKRNLSEEEKADIQAKVMEKNQTLRNFDYSELQKNSEKSISLAQLFCQERYTVMLGDPGSGKSTIVKWLALQFAMQFDQNSPQNRVSVTSRQIYGSEVKGEKDAVVDLGISRLPIVIKIPEYAKFFDQNKDSEKKGIIDFCGIHIPTIPGITSDEIRQLISHYLASDKAIVFLDGMDEVVKDREKILVEIRKFITYWINLGLAPEAKASLQDVGGNQIMITSRIVGYHAAPLDEFIKEVYVRSMDDSAIKSFCRLWTKETAIFEDEKALDAEASGLIDAIFDKNKPRIRELATNPLLITILALLYHSQNKKLPRNRVELYEETINILMGKWTLLHDDISPEDVKYLIEEVASFIHASPSEVITESDLIELLKSKLVELYPSSTLTERNRQAKSFVRIIRQDVGLLSERGQKLYHFLHRTFQEYLAARKMVRNPETATSIILDNLNDPVWREPVTMAVAYASSAWSKSKFSDFIDRLLTSKEGFAELIPRGILLISSTIPDLHSVDKDLFKRLVDGFLLVLGDKKGLGRFTKVIEKIKTQLQKLRESEHQKLFFECCSDLLAEDEYGPTQWELLNLACEEEWPMESWLDNVYQHIENDPAKYDFPVDRYLRHIFSTGSPGKTNSLLRLKTQLLKKPTLEKKINENSTLLRLIGVLYGGWISHPKFQMYKELEEVRRAYLSKSVEMEDLGYQYAVRLDTELGKLKAIKNLAIGFDIRNIHRECFCTRAILISLESESPMETLIPYFKDEYSCGDNVEDRALALAALAAIGEDLDEIIESNSSKDLHDNSDVLNRFIEHMERVEKNIQLPLFEFVRRSNKIGYLRQNRWNEFSTSEEELVFDALMHKCNQYDLAPPLLFPGEKDVYINENELDLEKATPELRNQRFADSLLALTMPRGVDASYACATHLDVTGGRKRRHNEIHLIQGVLNIPNSALYHSKWNTSWILPGFFFPEESDRNQLASYLRIVLGISPEFSALRDYLIHAIRKKLEAIPGMMDLAMCLFLNQSSTYSRKLFQERYGFGNPIQQVMLSVQSQKDPFLKFLMAYFIDFNQQSMRMLFVMEESLKQIESYQDWITAYLMAGEIELHARLGYYSSIISYFVEDRNPTNLQSHREDYANTILERLQGSENTLSIAYSILYAIDLATDDTYDKMVDHAIDLIILIDSEKERASYLKKLAQRVDVQAISKKRGKWNAIVSSFEDETYRNVALGTEYKNLIKISNHHHAIKPLNMMTLSQMADFYKNRYKKNEGTNSILQKIIDNTSNEADFRKLLESCKNGIQINALLVNCIDVMLSRGEYDKIKALTPLFHLGSDSDIEKIEHWKTQELECLSITYYLLLGETKVLNIQALDSLITILKSYPDRMVRRALVVLHGAKPTFENKTPAYRTSQLGYEFVKQHYLYMHSYVLTNPHISSVLSWARENWIDDNPTLLEKAVNEHSGANGATKKAIESLIINVSRIETVTFEPVLNYIKSGPEALKKCFWQTLAQIIIRINEGHFITDFDKKSLLELANLPSSIASLKELEKSSSFNNRLKNLIAALNIDTSKYGDLMSQIEVVIENIKSDATINFTEYLNDEEKLWEAFVEFGFRKYYNRVNKQQEAQNFVKTLDDNISKLQLLIKLTLYRLEDDLYQENPDNIGTNASYLLAVWAQSRPEFISNFFPFGAKAERLLSDVIKQHRSYQARAAAIKIVKSLNIMSKNILQSLIGGITDIDDVKVEAIQTLIKYSDQLDEKTFVLLSKILDNRSGDASASIIKMFANISLNPAMDNSMRKSATNLLATKLILHKTSPEKNMFLYDYNSFITPVKGAPTTQYRESIDDVLYLELMRLTGI